MMTNQPESIGDGFDGMSPVAPEFDALDSDGLAGGMERSGFSRYSLRRKTVQTFLLMVTGIALAGTASGLALFAPVEWSAWRWALAVVCCLCLATALVAIVGYVKNGLRSVMLEEWIRRDGGGGPGIQRGSGGEGRNQGRGDSAGRVEAALYQGCSAGTGGTDGGRHEGQERRVGAGFVGSSHGSGSDSGAAKAGQRWGN